MGAQRRRRRRVRHGCRRSQHAAFIGGVRGDVPPKTRAGTWSHIVRVAAATDEAARDAGDGIPADAGPLGVQSGRRSNLTPAAAS
jgi:hypothetical protein